MVKTEILLLDVILPRSCQITVFNCGVQYGQHQQPLLLNQRLIIQTDTFHQSVTLFLESEGKIQGSNQIILNNLIGGSQTIKLIGKQPRRNPIQVEIEVKAVEEQSCDRCKYLQKTLQALQIQIDERFEGKIQNQFKIQELAGLQYKLKSFSEKVNQNQKLTEQLENSQSARTNLQNLLKKKDKKMTEQFERLNQKVKQLIQDKNCLNSQLAIEKDQNFKLNNKIQSQKQKIQVLKKKVQVQAYTPRENPTPSSFSDTTAIDELSQRSNQLISSLEKEKQELIQSLSTLRQTLKESYQKTDNLSKQLLQSNIQNQTLNSQKISLQKQLLQAHQTNNQKCQQVSKLKQQLLQISTQLGKVQIKLQASQYDQGKSKQKALQSQIQTQTTQIKSLQSNQKIHSKTISELNQNNHFLRNQIRSLQSEIENLTESLNRDPIDSWLFQDLKSQLHQSKSLNQSLKTSNCTLQSDIHYVVSILLKLSQINLFSLDSLQSLVSQLEIRESQIDRLYNLLKNVKQVYTPFKNDPVDQQLASYLNSRKQVLKVPFVREDFGVYSFGTKKVFVKIQAGKIIMRVGGGYMSIEEFIDLYSVSQLEKMSSLEMKKTEELINELHFTNSPGRQKIQRAISQQRIVDRGFTQMIGLVRNSSSNSSPRQQTSSRRNKSIGSSLIK